MDIQKFQQKLTEVCELGEKNGKVLKPEQIKECFGELDLDKSQLIKILQYLKLKGISIEGAEEISAASQTGPEEVSEEKEEKVPLTAEEEAYLKEYLEGLEEQEQGERSAEELFELLSKGDALAQAELSQKYLHAAAEMAVEMNCEEIFIADLIQEANISLLMALGEEEPEEKDEKWLHGECVSVGCCLAAEISCIKGNISKEEVDDIKGVFEAFDMNGDISELSADDIVKTTKSDKKMVGDKIKFVLLRSVGDAYIDMSVTDDEMKQVLQG